MKRIDAAAEKSAVTMKWASRISHAGLAALLASTVALQFFGPMQSYTVHAWIVFGVWVTGMVAGVGGNLVRLIVREITVRRRKRENQPR